MGCSRARHRADGGVCHSSVRQRTTANEPANHGPRFTPHCWLSRDTPRTTPTQAHPRWRPGGSAPQTPRDLSPLCQARREKQKRDAQRIPSPISAPESALGSHLRVALSSVQVTDHFICDRIAEPLAVRAAGPKRRPSPAVPAQRRAVRQSQIRFLGDMPGVEPMALRAFYAILGGRFFQTRLKFPVQPHFRPNPAPHGQRPAAPSTMKPKRQRNSNAAP